MDICSAVRLADFTLRDPAQYAIEITGGPSRGRFLSFRRRFVYSCEWRGINEMY
jgi:hypothetical protein